MLRETSSSLYQTRLASVSGGTNGSPPAACSRIEWPRVMARAYSSAMVAVLASLPSTTACTTAVRPAPRSRANPAGTTSTSSARSPSSAARSPAGPSTDSTGVK